jgi:hypothetical protein
MNPPYPHPNIIWKMPDEAHRAAITMIDNHARPILDKLHKEFRLDRFPSIKITDSAVMGHADNIGNILVICNIGTIKYCVSNLNGYSDKFVDDYLNPPEKKWPTNQQDDKAIGHHFRNIIGPIQPLLVAVNERYHEYIKNF